MTELLKQAIDRARGLPPDIQDDIARLVLAYAGDDRLVIQLTPEEDADLAEADGEIERHEFATDEEVAATFVKYQL